MFLSNLSRREKNLLYLTLGIFFLSLSYKFALKPLSAKWSELNRQILSKEMELKRNVKYIRKKKRIKDIYLKYAGNIKKSASDEEEVALLSKEVEKEARASGIRIADIRPKPVKKLSYYKKYILEMNCEGTMEKYIEFIYNLQKSVRLVRVERLKLTSPNKDGSLLRAQMLITRIQPIQ